MAENGVVALDPPQLEITACEEEESDESAPLSPTTPQNGSKSYGSAWSAGGDPQAAAADQSDTDNIDPFTFAPTFQFWHKLLIAFNALWLFPLRLFLIIIPMTILGTIVCATSTWCEHYDPDNPTPRAKWRRKYADTLAPIIDRVWLYGFGFNWIRYKGRPVSTKEAPVVAVAPHSSMLDSFVVSLFGVPSFVARDDMRRWILFGPIMMKGLRTIFVKRDDPESRMKAARDIQMRASSKGEWAKVLLYPEGTTSNRKMVLSFKKGAFLPGVPVQPMLIKYQSKLETTTWGRNGWNQLKGLFYTICQFHNSLEIEFLDVYNPSEEEKADAGLFAKNVQAVVAKHLGKPIGIQGVEDNFFMNCSLKLGLPFRAGLILYNRLSKETSIRFDEIRDNLTRFASIDRDKDGYITPDDMAAFLSVPNDACLQALFWTTDKAAGEKLTFKQYLYGFPGRARPLLNDELFMKSVFDFFDRNNDGVVSVSDISRVLPVTKLPSVQPPQVRRRRRGRDSTGDLLVTNGSNYQVPVTVEAEMPGEEPENIDFTQFKVMLETNPEYLLLFHECQNAAFSSPSSPSARNYTSPLPPPDHAQDDGRTRTKVLIDVKEAEQ